ncbi:hypothetical protein [Nocardia goodfellowii]|uniref:Uncharacterized protein n=1 Tax=Nocardia goodfellowii TaxID=882446 RepID=A0ABS4QFL3_9NOCA|nr:hypothetical protein [Nocardia goodfellowii]MBP2190473.1 hypothetical protein [Nocardia goodfellowii]
MEHGQQGGESIGEIISGIAEILREVSDKLDAVAARVDEARDESSVAARLAKLEAWAFRTDQDISKLGSRIDGVESGTRAESVTRTESAPTEPAPHAQPVNRPEPAREEPATRAERRERARAENPAPAPAQNDLPQRTAMPQRGATPARAEGESAERPLPRAVANRSQPPARADQPEPVGGRGTAPVADTAFSSERRLPTVPAALNDWVEPTPEPTPRSESAAPAGHSERLEPVGITPRDERFTPSGITEAAPNTTPQGIDYAALRARNENQETARPPGLTDLPTRTPQSPANLNGRGGEINGRTEITGRSETFTSTGLNGRLENLTNSADRPENSHFTGRADTSTHITGSGRLEPPPSISFDSPNPTTNGRNESSLTSPRPDPDISTTAPQRPTIDDNAHVDKLQAMLDELKRNPHGPFGRPLSNPPGDLP